MARVVRTGGLLGSVIAWLGVVLAVAWAARKIYDWLAPLIPSLITAVFVLVGLIGLLSYLARRSTR